MEITNVLREVLKECTIITQKSVEYITLEALMMKILSKRIYYRDYIAFYNDNVQSHDILEKADKCSDFLHNIADNKSLCFYKKGIICEGNIKVSQDLEDVLKIAKNIMKESNETSLSIKNIYKALLQIKMIAKVDNNYEGVYQCIKSIEDYLDAEFGALDHFTNYDKRVNTILKHIESMDNSDFNFLKKLGTFFTFNAKKGDYRNIYQKQEMLEKVEQVLIRKQKGNVMLLGNPGTGKTALVEKLAEHFIIGNVSKHLEGKLVYSLDISSIVAGCSLVGDIEEKAGKVIRILDKYADRMVVFIDEVHTIVGAGRGKNGGSDVANIFKPFLSRSKANVIAATTYQEYQRYLSNDPAFSRRFQIVDVVEPSKEDMMLILKNMRCSYESYYNIKIPNEALKTIIDLSGRYITDRYYPDKAIDLLDTACSKSLFPNEGINELTYEHINKTIESFIGIKGLCQEDEFISTKFGMDSPTSTK